MVLVMFVRFCGRGGKSRPAGTELDGSIILNDSAHGNSICATSITIAILSHIKVTFVRVILMKSSLLIAITKYVLSAFNNQN